MITVLFTVCVALTLICLWQGHRIHVLTEEKDRVRCVNNRMAATVSQLSETQPYG